jgi:ferritin-like metal-binding protein YciE
MSIHTLEDLFIQELSYIQSAEKQLIKALPKMARAASDMELAQCFEDHLKETENQAYRLERAFEYCGLKARRLKCLAMEELIEEGQEVIDTIQKGPLRDAALISAVQKVEHYEIAAYGSIVTLANQLGYTKAARLLEATLNEEKVVDERFADLAEGGINEMAQAA